MTALSAAYTSSDDALLKFGVIHLRGFCDEQMQRQLCRQLKECSRAAGDFCVSTGDVGTAHRREEFHELGDHLYAQIAEQLAGLSETQLAEPQWRRMAKAYSGESPVHVHHVTGKSYKRGETLNNHTDGDMPLYTMSLALGNACDFTIGKKTVMPRKNEINGTPITICMQSGDVLFFDGGSVPHAIDRIHNNTAPEFWTQGGTGAARTSLLFRATHKN